MSENTFEMLHRSIESETKADRDRNRLWWERMPMSYADWQSDDRLPKNASDYRRIESYLLTKSPFLSRFFAASSFAGKSVLDLGCGVGVLSCLLARKGAQVTAVDITEQGVTLTAKNAQAQGLHIHIVRTDAEAMSFADLSFDYVLSWGVVHHSPSTENALREVSRVLARGGRGLLMVYHKTSLVYYLRGLYWLLIRGKIWRGYTLETVQNFSVDGYYHRHFRRDEFIRCIEATGLVVLRTWTTQQDDPILPFLPTRLDKFLKDRVGWYLVAEVEKPS